MLLGRCSQACVCVWESSKRADLVDEKSQPKSQLAAPEISSAHTRTDAQIKYSIIYVRVFGRKTAPERSGLNSTHRHTSSDIAMKTKRIKKLLCTPTYAHIGL